MLQTYGIIVAASKIKIEYLKIVMGVLKMFSLELRVNRSDERPYKKIFGKILVRMPVPKFAWDYLVMVRFA